MTKRRVCIIAQFPPPIHGLSKAVETLYESEIAKNQFDFVKIDITNNKVFLKNFRAISKTKADIFYFTISQSIGGNIRDLLIMRLLRVQHKRCLIHLHGGYFRKLYESKMCMIQKKWNQVALNNINGAIVLGTTLRSIFDGLVEDRKIYVIPNCIDNDLLPSESEIIRKIEYNEPVYHILYLSNFIKSKGYEIVLKMAKEYKDNQGKKNVHFDFAGKFYNNRDKNAFISFIKKHELEEVVTYHGIVEGAEKKQLLKKSTFFVLPTSYPREGQPISILEAMGNGLVILSTMHAGIPDVVKNGENGCIKPLESDLSKSYLTYISNIDAGELKRIQLHNYKKTKETFLEDTYIKNLMRCFNSVC